MRQKFNSTFYADVQRISSKPRAQWGCQRLLICKDTWCIRKPEVTQLWHSEEQEEGTEVLPK